MPSQIPALSRPLSRTAGVGRLLVGPAQAAGLRTSGFQWMVEGTNVVKDFRPRASSSVPTRRARNEDTLVRLLRFRSSQARRDRDTCEPRRRVASLADYTLHITSGRIVGVFDRYVEKGQVVPAPRAHRPGAVSGARRPARRSTSEAALPDPVRLTDTTIPPARQEHAAQAASTASRHGEFSLRRVSRAMRRRRRRPSSARLQDVPPCRASGSVVAAPSAWPPCKSSRLLCLESRRSTPRDHRRRGIFSYG